MPRPKKPKHFAADKRNGAEVVLASTATAVREPPACPRGVGRDVKTIWEIFWSDPISSLVNATDIALVERWALAYDEYERGLREFRKERMVLGSTGQVRLNPMADWVKSREAELRNIEDRLGISPLARARLGIVLGEAKRSLADMNAELTQADDVEVIELD